MNIDEVMKLMQRYPKVICADGFEFSVQANSSAYCSPRVDGADKYQEVEVGFPNAIEPMLMDFVEDEEKPTDTVYPYVPVSVVTSLLAKHGGMVSSGDVPPGIIPLRASSR
jgi:hypothetical protein